LSTPAPSSKTAIILTALQVETRAVLRHLDSWSEEVVEGTVFHRGRFEEWEVAVAEIGAGNATAAAVTQRAVQHFRPQVALFVGVAGGVKDVALGDVIVATKIYGYESGKEDANGFNTRPEVLKSAHVIEQRGRAIGLRDDWRKRLDPSLRHEPSNVIVGPIAAGEKVVASSRKATARLIKKSYGDTVAVEMEGRGFLEGVHINSPVQGGVVRGISDLLDGKQRADKGGSQQRAADGASAVAFEILASLDGRGAGTAITFSELAPTYSKAVYFAKGEVLARVGVPNVDEVTFSYEKGPDAYLRLLPAKNLSRPLPLASLKTAAAQAPLLRASGYGGLTTINKHGALIYDPAGAHRGGPAPLHVVTQLFPCGELWCMSDSLIVRERGSRPAYVPIPLIPTLRMEQAYYKTLHAAVPFAIHHMALAFPAQVEFGLLDLEGVQITVPTEETWGPIQRQEVVHRTVLASADPAELNRALLEFFGEVFDKAGYERPQGMHGFPAGPPHP
jgi:nucleoside phosphorylase